MVARWLAVGLVAAAVSTLTATGPSEVNSPPMPAIQTDLDAFMEQVLARRDENWKKLQQYILEEREKIDVRGPSNVPIWGQVLDYAWFIRDGYFVRSPTKVNGVTVSEDDRRKAEDDFLRRARARDERAKKSGSTETSVEAGPVPADQTPGSMDALLTQTRRPEFMDAAYFLRFKFERGKYALVGRETFDGEEVLRIEYYPMKLFSDEEQPKAKGAEAKPPQKKKQSEDDLDATIERLMNKVSLVTLWVEPKAHQIVKYTFDNVHMDFLPAAWLFRVESAKATMTMNQPFKGVWLPHGVTMSFAGMLAIGRVTADLSLDYHDYREAATSARIKGAVN